MQKGTEFDQTEGRIGMRTSKNTRLATVDGGRRRWTVADDGGRWPAVGKLYSQVRRRAPITLVVEVTAHAHRKRGDRTVKLTGLTEMGDGACSHV